MPKTVLITGATSGLGLELALLYADCRLILIGRKATPELNLFQDRLYCQCDLAKPNADKVLLEFLDLETISSLDLLIHNAALGYYGHVVRQTHKSMRDLLQVNLYTPIALSKALLPRLQVSKGKMVFISSIAAHLPTPDYAVYSASKAALSGFARNLRLEHPDLHIQTIYPGAIQTSFRQKSGVPQGTFKPHTFPTAKVVAKNVFQAIQSSKKEVTIGMGNRLARSAGRYFSDLWDAVLRSRS